MSAIATVVSVTGKAFARNELGELRELKPGDILLEGEVIVTKDGGSVELKMSDGSDYSVVPGSELALSFDMLPSETVDAQQESVTQDDVAALLDALESGVDFNEVVEETAAGSSATG